MKKRTMILSLCAMAVAVTLGATPAMARGDHHDRDGRGYHGKHYSKHNNNHHHWRNGYKYKPYRPQTVVNFSYGWPGLFSYYSAPAYYPAHVHTAYCHHW